MFDKDGKLTGEIQLDKDGEGHDTTYHYDADGKLYGSDTISTDGAERGELLDENGNLASTIQINKDGSAIETEYENGVPTKTTYYDAEGKEQTVEAPKVPPMKMEDETVETNNVSQAPSAIEAEIKKDMLQAAGINEAPQGGIRNVLAGLSKLNFLQKGKKNDISIPKKDTQDKQPFYKNILTKKGNNH